MRYSELKIEDFLNKTASTDSMPGGGTVSALIGASAVALALKVCNLSLGKEKYRENENLIKESSLYNDGKIYFQNLSTMLPIISYYFKENDNVLDMCAAPGGKTVLLSSIMENKISITALEIKKPRYE